MQNLEILEILENLTIKLTGSKLRLIFVKKKILLISKFCLKFSKYIQIN